MKSLLLSILYIFTIFYSLSAANIQWTGNASSAWSETANWDCNCLPGSDDDVYISTGDNVVLDIDATIRHLTTSRTLHINSNTQLTIDGQNSGEMEGISIINQSLIIDGRLVITGMIDQSSLDIHNADVIINGELIIDQPGCSTENCPFFRVVDLTGHLVNNGNLIIQKPTAQRIISVFGSLENNGLIEVDSAFVRDNILGLGQGATFINDSSAIFRMTNIIPRGNLPRGLQNAINDVTVVNDGELIISSTGGTLWSIDLKGSNTTFLNRGTLEVTGGKYAILSRDLDFFRNEGSIEVSGQVTSGAVFRGPTNAQNEGNWRFIDGSVTNALLLIGINGNPEFINRGDLSVENYLTDTLPASAIKHLNSSFSNFGNIDLSGGGANIGWELDTNILINHPEGYIRCDDFGRGFKALGQFENHGEVVFGPGLNTAFFSGNRINMRNTGQIGGFGNIQPIGIEWLPGGTLAPGETDTLGTISLIDDLNLATEDTIVLDISTDGNDQVRTSDSINFSGTIQLNLMPGFEPISTTYTLLEASEGLAGTPNVELPALPSNWEWTLMQDESSLQLVLSMISSANDLNEQEQLAVYPNPVASGSDLFLSLDQPLVQSKARLMQLNGRVIKSFDLAPNQNRIKLPALPAGIYLLSLGDSVVRLSVF